jgi:hypothetical protein
MIEWFKRFMNASWPWVCATLVVTIIGVRLMDCYSNVNTMALDIFCDVMGVICAFYGVFMVAMLVIETKEETRRENELD